MPELPEVEVIVRGLRKKIVGRKILSVDLNLPKIIARGGRNFARILKGLVFRQVSRRGKYIILGLSDNKTVLVHLKMTGQLIVTAKGRPLALKHAPVEMHTHLILDLSGGLQLRFRDIRQFGRIYLIKKEELSGLTQLVSLGPEADTVSKADFISIIRKRKSRIKALLLDQRFLAGLGNIYSDEVLHQAGIHPLLPADKIPARKINKLHRAITKILAEAISCGGSSVENYLNSEGRPGRYQGRHKVYRRQGQPCLSCGSPIQRIRINGRGSCFCPLCQRGKEH